MQELHLLVTGRVQGVSYRVSAAREAQRLGLAGWVRNLPDGRVELLAQGDAELLRQLRDWCRQGPSLARVDALDEDWRHIVTPCHGFSVRG
ncbi:MAG: acylphosphatase [Moraxellaceae bacterium]